MPRRTALLALALAAAAGLTACAEEPGSSTAAAGEGGPVTVNATDTECALSRTELTAGRNVFTITNGGSQVTEVYVYEGDRIVTEKENIGPGIDYELTTQIPPGNYDIACVPGMVGDGIRTPVTVTEAAEPVVEDPAQVQAVSDYRTYVQQQADALVPLVEEFVAAVKAGDVATAKALYAPSRYPWESIEPVAESFGDLDPKVDLREADLEPGQEWTGWHKIEKALFTGAGTTAGMEATADLLLVDIKDLQGRVQNADLSAASVGNGAKELLDEVATGKITGEEEAFSHTDLVDFDANLAGAKRAYDTLKPIVTAKDPALAAMLDTEFGNVAQALVPYSTGGQTYVSYDTVAEPQRMELARVVDALSEPLSRLAAVAAG